MNYWLLGSVIAAVAIVAFFVPVEPFPSYGGNKTTVHVSVEVVAQNLEIPWALDFLPDRTLIFTERPGRVNIIKNGSVETIATLNVEHVGEGGLLGIAVDPDYTTNRYIYLYHTYRDERLWNRVVRFTIMNNTLTDMYVVVDKIPAAEIHSGGRLKFHDGLLYATTGDAAEPHNAQNLSSLAGKILRIGSGGSLDDNPFDNTIVSYGHRNPQGLAWHPETNELYATEHGPRANDEINRIIAGANYGWPNTECTQAAASVKNPIRCFTSTVAPSGATFARSGPWKNSLLVATLRGSKLIRLVIDNDTVREEEIVLDGYGRLRDVVEYEGSFYVLTSNRDGRGTPAADDDKILKITTSEIPAE